MKKSILILAFLVWGSLWIYSTKFKKNIVATVPHTVTKEAVQATTKVPVPTAKNATPQNNTYQEDTDTMPEEETQTSDTSTMYKILSMEEASSHTSPRKNITPVAAIEMQTEQLQKLKVNDTLKLPDIEGFDYEIRIKTIQNNDDGSVTTTGSFSDEGISYTTTITHSNQSTFITLSTPKGIYEIETRHETGYIYRTQDIRKHLQKSHTNDVIILPVPKAPVH